MTINRLGSSHIPVRKSTPAYLAQAARAMEYAGFHAILIPTGSTCHDARIAAAAQFSDTYLLWGELPGMVRDCIERTSELAARHGRKLKYGYRIHIISRGTKDEAWAEADRLLREVPKQDIERAQRNLRASQSVGHGPHDEPA